MSSAHVEYVAKTVPTARIRRFKMQPRGYFDPAEITARALSMLQVGQQLPIIVEAIEGDPKHDYELVDGESRWLAAKEAGLSTMLVLVRSTPFKSSNDKHLASLVANFNRSGHTPLEISDALYLQTSAGMAQKVLARSLGKPERWVSDHLALQKLHPEVKKLLDPRLTERARLAVSSAVALSRVPMDAQLSMIDLARRSDGRIIKAKLEQAIERTHGKKERFKRPSRIREAAANAMRTIELAGTKIKTVSIEEAREIFAQLKRDGELGSIASVEELMLSLGQEAPLSASLRKRFPDMPVIKHGASEQERVAHAEVLRQYWMKKATDGQLLIAVAYPYLMNWKPRSPTKWHASLT